MTPARVLQVLADTDADPVNRFAVDLHPALSDLGFEVRTLALAPGATGELASVIPAISPSRRSLAATTELRREARWADVVLFHSARAIPPGLRFLRVEARLVLCAHRGDERSRVPSPLHTPCDLVVARTEPDDADADAVTFAQRVAALLDGTGS
jgi:hypothetical protein